MAGPIGRGMLSFGLVAIPVEIHTATKSQHVAFHLLHAAETLLKTKVQPNHFTVHRTGCGNVRAEITSRCCHRASPLVNEPLLRKRFS
jgi:hypothetical protein